MLVLLSSRSSFTRRNQSSRGTGHDVYSAFMRRVLRSGSRIARSACPRDAVRRSGFFSSVRMGWSIVPVSVSMWYSSRGPAATSPPRSIFTLSVATAFCSSPS